MIHDLALRWIVTALFGLSALECLSRIALGPRHPVGVVGHLLHAVMAVAMAVMAWPAGADLPTTGPMVFFGLAALWFAVVALSRIGAGHRIVTGYHTLMMSAMAWMYAVMGGGLLPGGSPGTAGALPPHDHHGAHSGMDMPGMSMPGMDTAGPTTGGGPAGWISTVNWVCTIGFGLAAAFWLYRYLVVRQDESTESGPGHLGVLSELFTALGMAIMFGVML